MLSLIFKDTVVLKIWKTNTVVAGMYIPPRNSSYFRNCELIMTHFENNNNIITGDMNACIGTISDSNQRTNPDVVINRNGKNFIDVRNGLNNGLRYNE